MTKINIRFVYFLYYINRMIFARKDNLLTNVTYKLWDLIGRCYKISDPSLSSEWCISTRMVHPCVHHCIWICVSWLHWGLFSNCSSYIEFLAMQIQIVRIFKCIINTVLAIIRDESVSEIVSKKSLLIHTAPQTALWSKMTTRSKMTKWSNEQNCRNDRLRANHATVRC